MASDDRLNEAGNTAGVPLSDERARRLSAKRINESLRHFNAFANTIGAGVLATAVIIPFVKDHAGMLDADGLQWCAIGILFHALAYMVVFLFLQSEE